MLDPKNHIVALNYGNCLADAGMNSQAVDVLQAAVELSDGMDSELFLNLGVAAKRSGMKKLSIDSLRRSLELKPDQVLAKRLMLAQIEDGERSKDQDWYLTEKENAEYARILFDDYAEKFEEELTQQLDYKVPEQIVELLLQNVMNHSSLSSPDQISWNSVLDAGCGSGLVGEAIHEYTDRIFGVDISQEMVKKTRERRCADGQKMYTMVEDQELVAYMRAQGESSFDAIVAADVLCYFGDLVDFFKEARRILATGQCSGWLAFSTEDVVEGKDDGKAARGFCLLNTGR
mmetsp:Transcript_43169/g.136519  ORF Transcript_43169/g.136519 Transcript_43169/m.136519 type:complete len:289 (+) Transcript_43169:621-1487(+)